MITVSDPSAAIRIDTSAALRSENARLHPLSKGQFSIWLAQALDPASPGYNVGECVEILGGVNVDIFRKALCQVVAETDALHLRFIETDDGPRQHLVMDPDWVMPFLDVSAARDPRAAAEKWMYGDMARVFDLARGPLFRSALFRLRPDCFLWYATVHHLINDGAGWRSFLRRVADAYTALLGGRPYPMKEPGAWFDLLAEEEAYRASAQYKNDGNYWRAQLTNRPEPTTLSVIPPVRPTGFIRNTGWVPRSIDLAGLGRIHGGSLAAVFLAAVAIYMYRVTGERDVILGVPVAARVGRRARDIAGLMANVLPLRIRITPQDTLGDVLRQTARRMREALRHQRYRSEDLRRDLGLRPDEPEIFRTVVNFTELDDNVMFGDCGIRLRPLGNWRVEDLQIVYYGGNQDAGARIDFVANSALYDSEMLDRHTQGFIDFLCRLSAASDVSISRLKALTDSELCTLLHTWNDTFSPVSSESVPQLFAAQAAHAPSAAAVVCEDLCLTYAELDARANRLARHLKIFGVGPEVVVGVCIDRSLEMLVALIGVLKAGGVYMPLDPVYPTARIALMIADARAPVVVTRSTVARRLPTSHARIVKIDSDWPRIAEMSAAAPENIIDPQSAAYVIYTSGTTGAPNGVVVEHAALSNKIQTLARKFGVGPQFRSAFFISCAFDASIEQALLPFVGGGTTVVIRDEVWQSPSQFWDQIVRNGVNFLSCVPSYLESILRHAPQTLSLEHLALGGEAFSVKLWHEIRQRIVVTHLTNLYGPTEATIDATAFEVIGNQSGLQIPIGQPLPNYRAYVLDEALGLLPVGAVGELYLAGEGLARGYLYRPGLTAERFVADPYGRVPGARMYRTGDLARWRSDGMLDLIGRADDQLKLRGFRIERGEIEAALNAQPAVAQAAVVAREDGRGDRQLVAYLVARPGMELPASSELRANLSRILPDPMIPAAFLRLETLPITPSGKLDRRALPPPEWSTSGRQGSSEAVPRTLIEEALCEIWRDSLRIERVERCDDFFELGGHSLLAAQVMSRVRKVFELEMPLSVLFEARTLDVLAGRIDAALRKQRHAPRAPQIDAIAEDGPAPLSFSQHRMWVIQSLDPQNTAYNMSGAIRFVGPLDIGALSGAMNELRRRHESLRSTIVDGRPLQHVEPWVQHDLTFSDLSALGGKAWPEAMRQIEMDARTPVDLVHGPVLRTALFRTGEEEHLLQMTLHHISGDQWSIGVMGRELATMYNNLRRGRAPGLAPGLISYRDYALWEQRWLQRAETEQRMAFWRRQLADLPPLELFTDRPRGRMQSLKGTFLQAPLPAALLSRLEQLSRREASTLFMTMFAAFATLLHRLSGQEDIAIGVPVANRPQSVIEGVVGTFVNTIVLRVDLSGNIAFRELLCRVRTAALDAFAHQDVPFDKLVHELVRTRDASRPPVVQVLFNLANAPMHGITFDGLTWEPVPLDRGGAQFELSVSIDTQVTQALSIEFNTDLFERATIERLIGQYLQLLESVVTDPHMTLGALPLLPAAERRLVLEEWNSTVTSCPSDKLFVQLFEARVAEHPDAPALWFEGIAISYGQLNARANAVAHQLRALEVKPGVVVGLCLNRSIDLVVALIGIQKSGGVYLPLDPSLPSKRLEYMLSDSGVVVLVTAGDVVSEVGLPEGVRVFDIDAPEFVDLSTANPDGGATPSDVAYIIYTSGSTGKPKGVAVSHASLTNFLWSMKSEPGLSNADVLAAVTTVSFDIAGLEFYLPLMVGARIELVAQEKAADGESLSRLLASSGASVMQATPATWRMLLDAGWNGRKGFRALCGGETLPRDLADALLDRVDELWNLYGPTETTVWSTVCQVERGSAPISIGRPIANTQIYVVDRGGALTPIGIPGEIWIGGSGVALGYHRRPELTAEGFVPDRFSAGPRGPLYRTGDLGRWGADGRLYHMGRLDRQLKVRGFRIELGEIEATVGAHSSVRQAVVVADEVEPGDVRLAAYVVLRDAQNITATELRNYLRQQLPNYMVPLVIVALDSIPLTPNGKVDRTALPDPFTNGQRSSAVYEQPAPGLEQLIAGIWREVLKIDQIGAEDNFFELGGHSLLSLRVAALVEKRTGLRMDPRVLFFQNLRQVAVGVAQNAPAAQTLTQ